TTGATGVSWVRCSRTASRGPGRTDEREADAQDRLRDGSAPLEQLSAGERRPRLRDEEGSRLQSVEAGRLEVGAHVNEPVLARVEVEDELAGRVAGDALEQRAAIGRVVDGAKDRRRLDGTRRDVRVEIGIDDLAPAFTPRVNHLLVRVHADVALFRQELGEPPVAAREIEDGVARTKLGPEGAHQLRATREIRVRVRVRGVAPLARLRPVLLPRRHRSARSRSGCLRRKRSIARACQRVWRVRKRLSMTAAYSWRTTAAGTYQRSQPAFAAR